MKTYYVIESAIYTLTEKKETKLKTIFPHYWKDGEEKREERLQWIEKNGKFIATAIVENY
ncbi:MAG: hypothetical protein LBG80_06495 [Bacteroidales bacterium]|jgi:hypothetical protein|nr:hypothetical protein [Bacteroidales bacterium]